MAHGLAPVPPAVVAALQAKLLDAATLLPAKYRVLFALRGAEGEPVHAALLRGLEDSSALFRHEVAYCLGQRQDPAAARVLTAVLQDEAEHPMVRHEAAEALGAIGTRECLAALAAAAADPCPVVSQTCLLALQRIQHYAAAPAAATVCNGAIRSDTAEPSAGAAAAGPTGPGGAAGGSGAGEPSAGRDEAHQAACDGPVPNGAARYTSVDPAPAAPAGTPVAALRAALLDEDAPIFERYRALFGLRNAGGPAAVAALGAAFAGRSALLKHEVAYVLGQMQDAAAVDTLRRVLMDASEDAMVRHEAAEALGAIADERAVALLAAYAADVEPIVADSCVVALDMLEHERSGSFQYADTGSKHEASGPGPGSAAGEGPADTEDGGKAEAGPGSRGGRSATADSREALDAERWAGGSAAGIRFDETFRAVPAPAVGLWQLPTEIRVAGRVD